MSKNINSVDDYINALSDDRAVIIKRLRQVLLSNLPKELNEQLAYGMINYLVPLAIYPKGYHVKKDVPLPFIAIASQKHHIALYHMGMYGDDNLVAWFKDEYEKLNLGKPDMGKSCIRFKKVNELPYDLIGEFCRKMSIEQYIYIYENNTRL